MEETGEDIRVVRRVLVLPAIDGGVGVERGAGVLGGLHDSIWGDIDVNFYGIKMRRDFYARCRAGLIDGKCLPQPMGARQGFIGPISAYHNKIFNGTSMLRNIENLSPTKRPKNKIEHQISNEGCRCDLCQKIVINEMKVIHFEPIVDKESELTKGKREEFFSKFLIEYNLIEKMNRKVKVVFPEVCVFEKGVPTVLISKKRETLPMKVIKNKEKLNGFEIRNFFVDGFTFHNNFKERVNFQQKMKRENGSVGLAVAKYRREHFNYEEALKNECIVLVKYLDSSCQMMTPVELSNLFKSKQRQLRQEIIYISTIVSSSNYNEIRIPIKLGELERTKLFERAKNEVKMINEDIKPKDFMFVPERDERNFEEVLKDEDPKKYLQYICLKLVLLYSLRTDTLFRDSIFKFVKDEIDSYYMVDVQVYEKGTASKVWGIYDNSKAYLESPEKPEKKRIRPTSSPERLQKYREAKRTKPLNVEPVLDFVVEYRD